MMLLSRWSSSCCVPVAFVGIEILFTLGGEISFQFGPTGGVFTRLATQAYAGRPMADVSLGIQQLHETARLDIGNMQDNGFYREY